MSRQKRKPWHYVIVWEFKVRPGKALEFETTYGVHGIWARFFRSDKGYVRTELIRAEDDGNRYVTFDFWLSRERYEKFRMENAKRYRAIDTRCKVLTLKERKLGAFVRLRGRSPAHL